MFKTHLLIRSSNCLGSLLKQPQGRCGVDFTYLAEEGLGFFLASLGLCGPGLRDGLAPAQGGGSKAKSLILGKQSKTKSLHLHYLVPSSPGSDVTKAEM